MDALDGWSEFNVAMVGATAALAGLVIVAASVNIADIVKEVSLTARLAAGIAGLVLALSGSAIGLIPGIPAFVYGAAVVVLALLTAVFAASAAHRIQQNRHPENRMRPLKSVLGFLAPLAYLVGGVLLIAGAGSAALALFAAGSILAIVAALLVSWIVLVEVLR
jgi:hypothetical protein